MTMALLATTIIIPINAGNPNKEMGMPPTYVLNILGKDHFTQNDMQDSPDRHTIFVPLNGDAKIYVTQAAPGVEEDFQVLDANAVNDGVANLTLGQGYYKVYMAALGKPQKDGDPATADLSGTLHNMDYDIFVELFSDSITRNKKGPEWQDWSKILYMSWDDVYDFFYQYFTIIDDGTIDVDAAATAWTDSVMGWFEDHGLLSDDGLLWVFDFIEYLDNVTDDLTNNEYYWTYKNNGLRHLQIRFYQVKNRNWSLDELPETTPDVPMLPLEPVV
jgi:hypothetical protein